ncbi:hypothetical protein [Cedratvirus kamchatka]|uniref:Ankyrin repeat-containing protein n=1 Tax=Cedratvirus kamchatka TaxID=2716914 RepID=A0A6G8MYS1_9VIRU|nr:hypothetical protein [Cedratvirus kamchatka]
MNSMLMDFIKDFTGRLIDPLFNAFIQTGVKYIQEKSNISSHVFCKQSLVLGCTLGHLQTIHELGYPLSGNLFSALMKREDLSSQQKVEFLTWFQEKGIRFTSKDLVKAAKENEVDIIEWFFERTDCAELCMDDRVVAYLALHGHDADYIDKMKERGFICTSEVMAKAAMGNQLSLMKELHERGYHMDSRVLSFAALNDNLDMFVWATDRGLSVNQDCKTYANIYSPSIRDHIMEEGL